MRAQPLPSPTQLPVLVMMRSDDSRPAYLALVGLRPMVVHSIDEALKVLAERAFSGIVLDLEIPKQDTLSFVSAVRHHEETAHLKILALGCDTETSAALARDQGVDVVLRPECRIPDTFAEDVRAALQPTTGDFPAVREDADESGTFETERSVVANERWLANFVSDVTRVARPSLMTRLA